MLNQGKTQTPFHFWISFWPVAPMFGVEWRFQKFVPGPSYFRPADIAAKMTAASVAEAVKATSEAAEVVARAAEPALEAIERAEWLIAASVSDVVDTVETIDTTAIGGGAAAIEDAALTDEASAEPLRPAFLYDARPADADDLKRIKGVGPKLEEMLNGMGIYRFAQIAAFQPGHLAWVDANLTAFKGRPFRDDWVAQAKALL